MGQNMLGRSSLLALALILTSGAADAQQAGTMYWQCVAPSASAPQGSFCPASQAYPAAVQNQAQSSQTITPSNSTVYSPPLRALWIGDTSACNLALKLANDSAAVTWALPANAGFLPLSVKQVMSTNTTCATIIGLGYK